MFCSSSFERIRVQLKQFADPLLKGFIFRTAEIPVAAQNVGGGLLRTPEHVHVGGQIGDVHFRQPVLAGTEKVSGTSQLQVHLRDLNPSFVSQRTFSRSWTSLLRRPQRGCSRTCAALSPHGPKLVQLDKPNRSAFPPP